MKILFCLINMNLGGTEKSFLNLVETLPEKYEIDLLLLNKTGDLLVDLPPRVKILDDLSNSNVFNYTQKTPLQILRVYLRNKQISSTFLGAFYYFLYKITGSAHYIYKLFDHEIPKIQIKYDIAVAYAGPNSFISYYVGQKIDSVRKLQWIHFDISAMNFDLKTSRKLYKCFDEIKVVSNIAQKNFIEIIPELSSKVKVFQNVINVQKIRELSSNLHSGFEDDFKGFRILTVGRLTKQKGHDFAIPAIRRLVDAGYNIRYYIVGSGIMELELRNQTEKLNLEKYVVFLGAKINPYPFMRQTDIYLQPSRYEGQGITVLEAKIFNKPIILTNYTVSYDTITDGINGLIVEMNSNAIFRGLKRLLEDISLRNKFESNLVKENLNSENRTLPF